MQSGWDEVDYPAIHHWYTPGDDKVACGIDLEPHMAYYCAITAYVDCPGCRPFARAYELAKVLTKACQTT